MILDFERHCWRLDNDLDELEPTDPLVSAVDWGWACLALIALPLLASLGWHVLTMGWP